MGEAIIFIFNIQQYVYYYLLFFIPKPKGGSGSGNGIEKTTEPQVAPSKVMAPESRARARREYSKV
eukprot:scaffold86444_cov35-Tisochrysis_lutea.AAC.2